MNEYLSGFHPSYVARTGQVVIYGAILQPSIVMGLMMIQEHIILFNCIVMSHIKVTFGIKLMTSWPLVFYKNHYKEKLIIVIIIIIIKLKQQFNFGACTKFHLPPFCSYLTFWH